MHLYRFGTDSGLLPGSTLPLRDLYQCWLLSSSSLDEQDHYHHAGVLLNDHIHLVYDCARVNANLYVCTTYRKD